MMDKTTMTYTYNDSVIVNSDASKGIKAQLSTV